MQSISVDTAQRHLAEIIDGLPPGGEVVLTRNEQPVATIRATSTSAGEAPRFGTLKGTILYVAPDFDDIPAGFDDYLP